MTSDPPGYCSPGAFRRALTDRLRALAEKSRWTLPQLQRQIAYDRLLERLYLVDDGWIVKGAPCARPPAGHRRLVPLRDWPRSRRRRWRRRRSPPGHGVHRHHCMGEFPCRPRGIGPAHDRRARSGAATGTRSHARGGTARLPRVPPRRSRCRKGRGHVPAVRRAADAVDAVQGSSRPRGHHHGGLCRNATAARCSRVGGPTTRCHAAALCSTSLTAGFGSLAMGQRPGGPCCRLRARSTRRWQLSVPFWTRCSTELRPVGGTRRPADGSRRPAS